VEVRWQKSIVREKLENNCGNELADRLLLKRKTGKEGNR